MEAENISGKIKEISLESLHLNPYNVRDTKVDYDLKDPILPSIKETY